MNLPKFVIGDNTDFPEDIFVIHLEYPRFVINLKDDEVEFLEDIEESLPPPALQTHKKYKSISDRLDPLQ